MRPSLQLVRTDSIDSNATGPNNPGPGRNLGRLLDTIGGKFEHFLNSRAGRRGLGPVALAEEIRSIRRENADDRWWRKYKATAPTDAEYVALRKLCRKLLKYCR